MRMIIVIQLLGICFFVIYVVYDIMFVFDLGVVIMDVIVYVFILKILFLSLEF